MQIAGIDFIYPDFIALIIILCFLFIFVPVVLWI